MERSYETGDIVYSTARVFGITFGAVTFPSLHNCRGSSRRKIGPLPSDGIFGLAQTGLQSAPGSAMDDRADKPHQRAWDVPAQHKTFHFDEYAAIHFQRAHEAIDSPNEAGSRSVG